MMKKEKSQINLIWFLFWIILVLKSHFFSPFAFFSFIFNLSNFRSGNIPHFDQLKSLTCIYICKFSFFLRTELTILWLSLLFSWFLMSFGLPNSSLSSSISSSWPRNNNKNLLLNLHFLHFHLLRIQLFLHFLRVYRI